MKTLLVAALALFSTACAAPSMDAASDVVAMGTAPALVRPALFVAPVAVPAFPGQQVVGEEAHVQVLDGAV